MTKTEKVVILYDKNRENDHTFIQKNLMSLSEMTWLTKPGLWWLVVLIYAPGVPLGPWAATKSAWDHVQSLRVALQ